MSLDDPSNHSHAAMLEKDPADLSEPEWKRMARRQEAAEAALRARENRELLASETPEAEEARSDYRMRRRAIEIPEVHYARD